MKINKSRYAILGLLSLGPMSGYDIKKKFEKIASNFWNESYGQIYPILKRLHKEGLTTYTIEKQEGKPDRHIHEITAKGRDELRKWLLEPAPRQIGRYEILLKLFFGPMVSTADNIKQLKNFKQMHEKELADLRSMRTQLTEKDHDPARMPFILMTLRFGELVNEAFLKWSNESLDRLKKMES